MKAAELKVQVAGVGYLVAPSVANRGHLRKLRDMTLRALRLALQPHWYDIKVCQAERELSNSDIVASAQHFFFCKERSFPEGVLVDQVLRFLARMTVKVCLSSL